MEHIPASHEVLRDLLIASEDASCHYAAGSSTCQSTTPRYQRAYLVVVRLVLSLNFRNSHTPYGNTEMTYLSAGLRREEPTMSTQGRQSELMVESAWHGRCNHVQPLDLVPGIGLVPEKSSRPSCLVERTSAALHHVPEEDFRWEGVRTQILSEMRAMVP